jgi:hypothetical protein
MPDYGAMMMKSAKGFAAGDVVILHSGLVKTSTDLRTCTIVSVLPSADRGERQYRVQFDNENFERRVTESDIETLKEAAVREVSVVAAGSGNSWLKPLRSKTGRSLSR